MIEEVALDTDTESAFVLFKLRKIKVASFFLESLDISKRYFGFRIIVSDIPCPRATRIKEFTPQKHVLAFFYFSVYITELLAQFFGDEWFHE